MSTTKLSFFAKLKLDIEKLYKSAPAVDLAAANTLTYAAPILEGIVGEADPALLPEIEPVLATVKTDLATAALILKEAGSTPTALTFLSAIKDNLQVIEQAAQVKNPTTAGKVTSITTIVVTEVENILAEFTPAPAPAPVPEETPSAPTTAAAPAAPAAPVTAAAPTPVPTVQIPVSK